MIKNQKGTTLIEFALAAPNFLALIVGLLIASYYLYSHQTIRFQLQEALICSEEQKRTSECLDSLKSTVKKSLPFGSIASSKILLKKKEILGHFKFDIISKLSINEVQLLPRPVSRVLTRQD